MGWFSKRSSPSFDCIRVVHVSGYVEDFTESITVREIVGNPPKHFLCSSPHLLSLGGQPLSPDVQLQPGCLYFLLPRSIFQWATSPADFVTLGARLTAIGKRAGSSAKPGSSPSSRHSHMDSRNSSTSLHPWNQRQDQRQVLSSSGKCRAHMKSRVKTWKPILETIEERSFDCR